MKATNNNFYEILLKYLRKTEIFYQLKTEDFLFGLKKSREKSHRHRQQIYDELKKH